MEPPTTPEQAIGVTASLGCISSTLGIVTGSGACPVSPPNVDLYWNQSLGALYPNNSTVDVLFGGQATTSAQVAFLNLTNTTPPIASISAANAAIGSRVGIVLSAAGSLQTLLNSGLTIGGNTTGNITIAPNNGGAGSILNLNSLTTNLGGTTTLNATSLGTLNTAATLTLGNTSTITASSLGTLTTAATLGVSATTLNVGNGSAATIATTGNQTLGISAGTNTLNLNVAGGGAVTTGAGLTTLGGNLTVTGATVNIGNGSAATIQTPSTNAGITIQPNGSGTLSLGTGNTSPVSIGNSTGAITVYNSILPNATGTLNLGSSTGPKYFNNIYGTVYYAGGTGGTSTNNMNCVNVTGGIVTGAGSCSTTQPDLYWNQLNGSLFANNSTVDLLFGGQSTASANFKVTGKSAPFAGTTSAASVSAKTSFAAFVVDNQGVGDLFTASASGANRFVIRQNGSVGIGTTIPSQKLEVAGNIQATNGNLTSIYGTQSLYLSGNESGLRVISSDSSGGGIIYFKPGGTLVGYTNSSYAYSAYDNIPMKWGSSGSNFAQVLFNSTNQRVEFSNVGTVNPIAFLSDTVFLGRLGVNLPLPTSTFLATLDIRPNTVNGGTLAVASVSGKTSFSALVVDNSLGDIFSASASGTPRFTITTNGFLIPGITNAQDIGSSTRQWNNVYAKNFYQNGILMSQYWQENLGVLSPANITDDLVIGGTSTASAKFAVLNVAKNQPVATVAGQFIVMPQNGWGGQVGIGTTNPINLLDIRGAGAIFASISGSLVPGFSLVRTNQTGELDLGVTGGNGFFLPAV